MSRCVFSRLHPTRCPVTALLILFCLAFFGPLAWQAFAYYHAPSSAWWMADRSSAGLLAPAARTPEAVVRIYAARTVSWRGIFAVHSWRWFGQAPALVAGVDGAAAESMIPRLRAAIESYRFRNRGDYRAWPGPNSNTFVATVMAAAPELQAALPSIAIGKDFPADGRWIALTPSHTGLRLTLGGYAGVTIGWVEGFELNLFGGVLGCDFRRPAIKLPGVGRIGL